MLQRIKQEFKKIKMLAKIYTNLEELLESYSFYLAEKGKSENTIKAYKSDIYNTINDINSRKTPIESEEDLENFVSYIKEKIESINIEDGNSSQSSKNRKFSSFNSFARYLSELGYIKAVKSYGSREVESSLNPITEEQYKKLLDSIPLEGLTDSRDRVIFCLSYWCGISSEEIARINYSDFAFINNRIKFINVKKKTPAEVRALEINKTTADEIKNYEKFCKSERYDLKKENRYFSIGERGIRKRFAFRIEKISSDNIKFNSLRHAYTIKLLNGNKNIKEIAYNLGIRERRAEILKRKYQNIETLIE